MTHCCAPGVQPKTQLLTTTTPELHWGLCFLVASSHATPSLTNKQTLDPTYPLTSLDGAELNQALFYFIPHITVSLPFSWIRKSLHSLVAPPPSSPPLVLCDFPSLPLQLVNKAQSSWSPYGAKSAPWDLRTCVCVCVTVEVSIASARACTCGVAHHVWLQLTEVKQRPSPPISHHEVREGG